MENVVPKANRAAAERKEKPPRPPPAAKPPAQLYSTVTPIPLRNTPCPAAGLSRTRYNNTSQQREDVPACAVPTGRRGASHRRRKRDRPAQWGAPSGRRRQMQSVRGARNVRLAAARARARENIPPRAAPIGRRLTERRVYRAVAAARSRDRGRGAAAATRCITRHAAPNLDPCAPRFAPVQASLLSPHPPVALQGITIKRSVR